jgi:hypothetical protein
MATSTLKLQTNIPLTGFVRYANYYKGKPWTDDQGVSKMLPDQVQLKGSWDGSSDEALFLPMSLVGQMLDMGLLRQDQQPDKFGNPAYTVLNGTRKVRVLKTEDGKKKPVHISWADASATAAAPAAQTAAPSTPAQPAKAAAPAQPRQDADAQKRAEIRKAHRRALKTLGDTQANAWRGAKSQVDLLLAEWSIERTKIPTHVYLDLVARFAATSSIEAFRQNLIVEHKKNGDPAPAPGAAAQAGSTTGAAALKPIAGDAYEHGAATTQVADQPPPSEPGPVDNADYWPDEEDELPF